MKKLFLLIIPICWILACTSVDDGPMNQSSSEQVQSNEFKRSPQQALNIARDYFDSEATTSRNANEPLSLSLIKGNRTRSTIGCDTLCYVIQRGTNDGFVIVAADSRITELLAYSTEGSFEYEESDDNIVYSEFVSKIEPYVERTVNYPTIPPIDTVKYSKTVYCLFLVTDEANWDQRSPYNKYVVEAYDMPYVGCGAVAAGMSMLYSLDSITYKGEFYDFQKIRHCMNYSESTTPAEGFYTRDEAIDKIAKLLYYIGGDIGMVYTSSGSSSDLRNIHSFLTSIGCTSDPYHHEAINSKLIAKSMKQNNTLTFLRGTKNGGHFWIVDGYKYAYPTIYIAAEPDTTYMTNVALHCNWGWGGQSNGYYSGNVLNGWTTTHYFEVGPYKKSKYTATLSN